MELRYLKPVSEEVQKHIMNLVCELSKYGHVINSIDPVVVKYETVDIYRFGNIHNGTLVVNIHPIIQELREKGHISESSVVYQAILINSRHDIKLRTEKFLNNPPSWAKEFVVV